jgi:hypothetical protein
MVQPVDNKFPTLGDIYKRIDELACEIATMRADEPRRHDIVSELQYLNFVAESMKRTKPGPTASFDPMAGVKKKA